MTPDPTPDIVWPPHAIRRHVQEPAPDAGPADPPTWPEDAVQEVERLRAEATKWRSADAQWRSQWSQYVHPDAEILGDVPIEDDGRRLRGEIRVERPQLPEVTSARAERAESNARGKQAVIEAQRATLDRVRALVDAWERDSSLMDCTRRPNCCADARDDERVDVVQALRAIIDAPQPEAGGDDE